MGVNNTPFSQLPIPDKDAARDTPYWLSQLGSTLDTKLPVYAVNSTDRDARFAGMPLGTLCVSATDGTVWVKTSAATTLPATWGTVYQPPVGVTWTGITQNAGYGGAGYSGGTQAAQIGQFVYLRGSFAPVSGTWNTGLGSNNFWGHLPNTVKLPPNYMAFAVAKGYQVGAPPTARFEIFADGTLNVILNEQTNWVTLDGTFYYTG